MNTNQIPLVRKYKKMKKSWRQRFRDWLLSEENDYEFGKVQVDHAQDQISIDGLNFRVHKASGGYVIETRQYDNIKDRTNSKLYIIKDDQDLGENLGKIITMEALR